MVDDRQFIIIPQPPNSAPQPPKGGASECVATPPLGGLGAELALPCGSVLVYEKHLNVCCNEDCTAVLIGDAWQIHPSKDCPENIIKTFNGRTTIEDVYDEEKTWCGRYVLIVNDWLFLDFCGTLGVFYSAPQPPSPLKGEHTSPLGGWGAFSSSYRILCEQIGTEVVYPDTLGEGLMNFVPGPLTPSDLVRRLMPSEIINLKTGEKRVRPLNPDGIWNAENSQERINELEKYFTCSLRNMAKHFPDSVFWLALTGGKDSRTLMALLENSGIDYKAFTCWHERIAEADLVLPPKLAKAVGKPYKFIERREDNYSLGRADEYRRHTGGMADDADKPMYVYGQYQELDPNHQVVLLRSAIWPCSCNRLKDKCSRKEILQIEKYFDTTKFFPQAKKHELYCKALRSWEDLVNHDAINKGINLWDRLMIEERHGAWLSSIEQGFDLMEGIVSVECCNSRCFFSILTGFSDKDKKRKKHEMKIVKQICPTLSKYRYQDNLTLKKRIKNVLHDLKMRYT